MTPHMSYRERERERERVSGNLSPHCYFFLSQNYCLRFKLLALVRKVKFIKVFLSEVQDRIDATVF